MPITCGSQREADGRCCSWSRPSRSRMTSTNRAVSALSRISGEARPIRIGAVDRFWPRRFLLSLWPNEGAVNENCLDRRLEVYGGCVALLRSRLAICILVMLKISANLLCVIDIRRCKRLPFKRLLQLVKLDKSHTAFSGCDYILFMLAVNNLCAFFCKFFCKNKTFFIPVPRNSCSLFSRGLALRVVMRFVMLYLCVLLRRRVLLVVAGYGGQSDCRELDRLGIGRVYI